MEEKFNSSQDNFATEKVNVISNCLFGNYVNKEYIIADDIKAELTKVKKVKKSVFKNSVFCGSYIVGYGDVVFEVTFQKNTVKNIAKAELYVLENESKINGYIQNTIRTKVGEFVDELDNFIEKTYEYFNIELTDNRVMIDKREDPTISAYINAKKNFSLNMARLTKKEYNALYRNYVTARLELLKKANNDYANTVLDRFNGEFTKIENYFLKENNYKALSELLDKCIEDVSGVNPKFAQDEKTTMDTLVPIIDNFSKEADDIFEKAQPKAMNSLDKQDRTRMEDIEREMYEYQQTKKPEKVKAEKSYSSDDYSSPSSAPSKEPSKPQPKSEQSQTKTQQPQQKTESASQSSPSSSSSDTGLNQRPTKSIFPVNPTLPRRNQEQTQDPTPPSQPQINVTQGQNPTTPTQVVREQVIIVPQTQTNDGVAYNKDKPVNDLANKNESSQMRVEKDGFNNEADKASQEIENSIESPSNGEESTNTPLNDKNKPGRKISGNDGSTEDMGGLKNHATPNSEQIKEETKRKDYFSEMNRI